MQSKKINSSTRLTKEFEAGLLPAIERSAGRTFYQIPDLSWIADDDVQSVDQHRDQIAQGMSWVAVDRHDAPMGFLGAEKAGNEMHIWVLAVLHERQGSGHGRALLEKAMEAARERGLAAVTLTTFKDLAWNQLFYQRLGFVTLEPEQAGERLRGILRAEVEHGLPGEKRCAMRFSFAPNG